MKLFLNIFLIIVTTISCTKISELKKVTPKGNQFQQYLAKHYIEFAESEASQYDWIDSEYFANKAKLALYGHETIPEDPTKWKISKSFLPELIEARARLMNLITLDNINTNASNLALAQFSYDSWIEQQEENWQLDEIEKCKENFYKAINSFNIIEAAAKEDLTEPKQAEPQIAKETKKHKHPKKAKKVVSSKKKKKTPQVIKLNSQDYKIAFEKASKNLKKESKASIDNIILYFKSHPKTEFILNSYSNNLKNDDENLKFSKERALIIKQKLLKAGVAEDNIMVFAFGNSPVEDSSSNDQAKIELYIGE